jgi:glyoxylase-like metal-dependent hydrolase (beta-lactamase superfamily II)
MTTARIGSTEVLALSDGTFSRPPERFFPDKDEAAWAPYQQYLDDHGEVPLNIGSFLIRADGRTLLVDTGIGPAMDMGGVTERLPDALRGAGVAPEEIDAVLITHMHFDHIGWNTTGTESGPAPTFPRAHYLIQATEWRYWVQPKSEQAPHLTDQLIEILDRTARPLEGAGLLELVDGEHAVTPSVHFLPTPGHTPGHACILIDSGGEQAVILGDVAHNPVQVADPNWSVGGDTDLELGRRSRAALWERIEQHGLTVCAGHFTGPNIGRFVRVEGRRMWRGL